MKEFEVTMTVTSEKSFCLEADSTQEAAGKASRMLEDCDTFCVSKDEVQDMKIGCQEQKKPSTAEQPDFREKTDSNMAVFCKNLFAFCAAAGGDEQEVKDGIEGIYDPDFDPLLYFRFRPVCSFEVEGSEEIFPDYRHNRLFGKNGYCLSETVGSGVSAMSTVTQGYEVWLLEDMTLAVTFCCQMTVDDREGTCETAAYRYPIFGGYAESAAYFEADDVLNDVESAIYAAMKME